MIDARHRRRWAPLTPSARLFGFAVLALAMALTACNSRNSLSDAPLTPEENTPIERHREAAPAQEAAPEPVAAEAETLIDEPEPQDVVETPKGKAYRLWFKYRPGDTLYYTIENKLRDSGGVPPLLTYTTSIEDRRFMTQTILPPTPEQKNTATLRRLVSVSWECDRYDVREVGMKDDYVFDSLRHLYPPGPIRRLGGIPGSTSTFLLNPRTGEATRVRVQLAAVNGGSSGRGKLSKIAEKIQLSVTNLKDLLEDIGPYYLPSRSVRVGEQWVRTQRETHRTFGTIITKVTCTLDSVNEVEGRNIATILIDGEITLEPKPKEPEKDQPNAATTKPARRSPPKKSSKEYRIDKQACSGKVEFDITRGELVELTLRREREFVADVDSEKTSGLVTEIRQATSHELRVHASRTAPRHPTIVGGPKPPIEPVRGQSLDTPPRPKNSKAKKDKPQQRRVRTPRGQTGETPTTQPAEIPTAERPTTRPATQRMRPHQPISRPIPASQPTKRRVHTGKGAAKLRVRKDGVETIGVKQLPKGWRQGLHPATEGRASSRPIKSTTAHSGDVEAKAATSQPARETES